MKLRTQISLLLFMFGLVPLLVGFMINLPTIFDRIEALYHKAHLQNLRARFSDLDQHIARRNEMARLLAKMPEPGMLLDADILESAPGLADAPWGRHQGSFWDSRGSGGRWAGALRGLSVGIR